MFQVKNKETRTTFCTSFCFLMVKFYDDDDYDDDDDDDDDDNELLMKNCF